MATILVVEDDRDLREMLEDSLRFEHHEVSSASNIHTARAEISAQPFDLLILDWMLPQISGIQWLKQLRQDERYTKLPVIMLTAKGEVSDRVEGLDAGADDYLVKPFSLIELHARIRTQLKKLGTQDTINAIKLGGLSLNPESQRVRVGDTAIKLGPTEYRLLHHFMRRPERVFTRTQLLDSIWGIQTFVEERTVDVHIRRLRKALQAVDKQKLIQTVRGSGYRFSTEQES